MLNSDTPIDIRQGIAGHNQADDLMPLVYDELRKAAERYLQHERSDHTLQPTALVHEAYVRLCEQTCLQADQRSHFFRLAAKAMRNILVNHALKRNAIKRGGGQVHRLGDEDVSATSLDVVDVVALDESLTRLSEFAPQQAQVVELRFFGGLSVEETAETLEISTATVKRGWRAAKLFLMRELDQGE